MPRREAGLRDQKDRQAFINRCNSLRFELTKRAFCSDRLRSAGLRRSGPVPAEEILRQSGTRKHRSDHKGTEEIGR
jgi:hypothetical protein